MSRWNCSLVYWADSTGRRNTLVGVMQQGIGLATTPDRHDQRVGDELRRHRVAHRPADHTLGEQVDHCRHVEPAFDRPDIGEVGDPLAVRGIRAELAIEHIVRDYRAFAGVLGQPATPGPRLQPVQAHQPFDAVQAACKAFGQKIDSYTALEGYIVGRVMAEGLRRGGSALTRDSFIAGLESIGRTSFGEFPVEYSARNHNGSTFVDLEMYTGDGQLRR